MLSLCFLVGCASDTTTPKSPEENTTTLTSQDQSKSTVTLNDVFVGDINFVAQLDAIFNEIDDYIGKTIHMEGLVTTVAENDLGYKYAITRYYDLPDGDHFHTISVGLNCTYDGSWPKEGSWAQIEGIIETIDIDGEAYPIVRVTKLTPKATPGLEKVSS
ncbi:TIGR03943 family putative permease subunit [Sporanaerobium hydrogeniformans]|uniref:TIGR03943 family putative permease subunit n=1 Tax=Sporanaerobium hydrogeniformans TaxID=3072179 RepID=UPI00117BDBC9|nr:hypothetical protein [Sporanaerobium hydrogeniformans]